jgi:hypothetical protein
MRWFWRILALIGLLVILLYIVVVRPYAMQWGATADELTMPLPGDIYIQPNQVVSTRALTIHASADAVWPWLAQIGQNRGGFYSYHWLENLFAADMHNTRAIVPEWQWPAPGDRVYYQRDGLFAEIDVVDPQRTLSMGGWTFYLKPIDDETTRLVVRYPSFPIAGPADAFYYYTIFEPAHLVMEFGMMMGLKVAAESHGG